MEDDANVTIGNRTNVMYLEHDIGVVSEEVRVTNLGQIQYNNSGIEPISYVNEDLQSYRVSQINENVMKLWLIVFN